MELCSAISEGGLTPSAGLIVGAVRERGEMSINVLIRPRAGHFVYTTRELAVMEADIEGARSAGADGVVIGALTPTGEIDIHAMERLLTHCRGLDVTFHRAFDEVAHPLEALQTVYSLGIRRILTSGGAPTALQGAHALARLVEAAPADMVIMPGSGVSPACIDELQRLTAATEFHSTCTDKSIPAPCHSPLFGYAPRPTSSEVVRTLTHPCLPD